MTSLDWASGLWTTHGGIRAMLALCAVLTPVAWFIYNIYFHPLAGFPGPLLYRGTNLGKISQQMRGNITNKVYELHKIYGPVVRIAPWELSYSSAQAWKDIYTGSPNQKSGAKEPMPSNVIYGADEVEYFGAYSVMFQSSAVEHNRHRRILSPAFSDKSLREQEPTITKHVAMLMQRFRENAGVPIDLVDWFNYMAFDIIGDLTFGEPFGCLEESKMHPWIHFIFANLKGMMYGQIISTMGSLGTILKALIPAHLKAQVHQHASFSRIRLNARLSRSPTRPDFMTHITPHVGRANGLTPNEVLANAQILIMAGSETSATLLCGTAFFLMTNPEPYRKLKEEIRSAFASEAEITFTSISKLKYTLAVLHESMRMHPPVPAGIHRFTPPGGAFIDGKFVAGGTDVVVHQWSAYRSECNFRDADRFIPERWLGEDERYAGDNREVFNPFSIGPRACIGRGLAYMEMRLALARLVWGFDMELVQGYEKWTEQKCWVLYEKTPLMARVVPVQRG
ncbi:putative sterigmatocystin biosynthesis P450 monooxygenase stcF [Podospora aff. communis PSN243]|uniref:Sterigmatocystin biosynthesis P450 monooxygenase stcF n=1 Tax=Podospora aff. communis PSN243 TaxID=3040156 RepID=A0AAV9GG30_9PEZI|nr:putative sterigmatocystin biosynthesis P450 monooxygenase stcF [Podospora aff. communis PSN243]